MAQQFLVARRSRGRVSGRGTHRRTTRRISWTSASPGLRVPFIIISSWSKKGFVDHNQYETVSILAFIEGLYNLSPLNTRDANALPPVAAFLGEPDVTKP